MLDSDAADPDVPGLVPDVLLAIGGCDDGGDSDHDEENCTDDDVDAEGCLWTVDIGVHSILYYRDHRFEAVCRNEDVEFGSLL